MGIDALTEKEKATLRLIVRGHDAKSIARHFDLSVHTINERLRDARRKLGVPSSREAARLLDAHETPENIGDVRMGEAPAVATGEAAMRWPAPRRAQLGVVAMSFLLALAALAATPQSSTPSTGSSAVDAQTEAAALAWLALIDAGRWQDSFDAAGTSFRNDADPGQWADASKTGRAPRGAVRSRTLIGHDIVPAPPRRLVSVSFRTRFADGSDATERLTLEWEGGRWRVIGISIT